MTVAQISIGLYMGMLLDPARIKETARLMPFIITGILIIIAVSVAMAYYLSGIYGFSLITAFLAMAPGGIAEMCLAGMSMGENVKNKNGKFLPKGLTTLLVIVIIRATNQYFVQVQ